MADPSAESSFTSDIFGLKRISNSFPNVSSLFIGFSAKAPSESDSLRSPTSTLDFKFLSSLSNSFKLRSPVSSSNKGNQRKWDFCETGLGIINTIANEDKPSGEISCLQRNHIVFGLQANRNIHNMNGDGLGYTLKSKSLPRNFRILPQAKTLLKSFELGSENDFAENEQVQLEIESLGDFSLYPLGSRSLSMLSRTSQNQEMTFRKFYSDDFTANTSSAPVADEDSSLCNPSADNSCSLPIPITQCDGYVGPLSAKEIELSEDYTCIISYGPNSKTTHIFGDCILDCDSNNLCNFGEDDQAAEVPHMVESKGVTTPPFDETLRHCPLCKKKLEDEEEACKHGCETSVNTVECKSKEIVGEVLEKIQDYSHEDVSDSCNSDSLFTFSMPLATL